MTTGYDYINPYSSGTDSAASSYTVRDGETLQSIAGGLWGDATLWYLIAEANGLTAGGALIAGQTLIIPDRVASASSLFRKSGESGAGIEVFPRGRSGPEQVALSL